MSKGYTISFFIKSLSRVTSTKVEKQGVYRSVSPRLGAFSVAAGALDSWLDNSTTSIVNGHGRFAKYGKTPRARLLKALRNRKINGSI